MAIRLLALIIGVFGIFGFTQGGADVDVSRREFEALKEELIAERTARGVMQQQLDELRAGGVGQLGFRKTALAGADSIGSIHIQDASITTAKIEDATIGTAKIADASITNAKIADATIESAKIGSLSVDKLTAGTLDVEMDVGVNGIIKVAADKVRLSDDGLNLVTATDPDAVGEKERKVTWNDSTYTSTIAHVYGARVEALDYNYLIMKTFADVDAEVYMGVREADDLSWSSYLTIGQANGGFPLMGLHDGLLSVLTIQANGPTADGNFAMFLRRGGESPLISPLHAGGSEAKTIAAGVVTMGGTAFLVVDTEAAAATDNLDTITANSDYLLTAGQGVVLRAANSARSVVLTESGNIKLSGAMTLDNAEDTWTGMYDGTNWLEIARSNNGA